MKKKEIKETIANLMYEVADLKEKNFALETALGLMTEENNELKASEEGKEITKNIKLVEKLEDAVIAFEKEGDVEVEDNQEIRDLKEKIGADSNFFISMVSAHYYGDARTRDVSEAREDLICSMQQ